jgi:transcriptional/translational regulatory protein YebC/TACO1
MAASRRWIRIQHRRGQHASPGAGSPAATGGEFIEVYGPGGAAILVELDDGAGPGTTAAVRQACSRFHGSPGAKGAVSYLFNRVGLLAYPGTADHERIQAQALAAGAEDVVKAPDGAIEVLTAPADLPAVRAVLEAAGLAPVTAGVVQRSEAVVNLGPDEAGELQSLLDALAEIPGVRDVWCNGCAAP